MDKYRAFGSDTACTVDDGYVGVSQQFTISQNLIIDWPEGVPVKALVPDVLVPVTQWETYRDFVDFPTPAV